MGASEIRALGDQGSGAGEKPGEELDGNDWAAPLCRWVS